MPSNDYRSIRERSAPLEFGERALIIANGENTGRRDADLPARDGCAVASPRRADRRALVAHRSLALSGSKP
jgi:hypothetical protein